MRSECVRSECMGACVWVRVYVGACVGACVWEE